MGPFIIKNQNVRLAPSPVECEAAKGARLLEDGGRVYAIELRCSCGEVTILELDYADDTPANEQEQ